MNAGKIRKTALHPFTLHFILFSFFSLDLYTRGGASSSLFYFNPNTLMTQFPLSLVMAGGCLNRGLSSLNLPETHINNSQQSLYWVFGYR
jgi:hypothetical protein